MRAQAAAPGRTDLSIAITAGTGEISVSYDHAPPAAEMQHDFAVLAEQLHQPPPKVTISADAGITSAEAKLSGLADPAAGTVNLDPLLQAFRRYGHLAVLVLFPPGAQPQVPQVESRGPVRLTASVNGSVVQYDVRIDQADGVPATVPSVTRQGPHILWIAGLVALAIILGVSVYAVAHAVVSRRVTPAGEER